MNDKKVNVLDCTLRDGGYYTNWNFNESTAEDYFSAMAELPVGVVELGYLNIASKKLGEFAYVKSIDSIKNCKRLLSGHVETAIMFDAKQFFESGNDDLSELSQIIQPAKESGVDIIRVAVHYSKVSSCTKLVNSLIDLGYRVFINLMQINLASESDLDQCIKDVNQFNNVEVVYIADSLGSMLPSDVDRILKHLISGIKFELGFHGHNNRGLAILNSIQAEKSGATWIDCTISGMGRGSGNAPTEQLLPVFEKNIPEEKVFKLQKLVVDHFVSLKNKYNWGDNIFYNYAAINSIHPMYVQGICSVSERKSEDVFMMLKKLSAYDVKSYKEENLQRVYE